MITQIDYMTEDGELNKETKIIIQLVDKINELIEAVNRLEKVGDGLCHCNQANHPHIWQARFCPKDNAPKLV